MNESTLDLAVKLLEDLKHSDFEEDNNLAYALKKWIEFELISQSRKVITNRCRKLYEL